MEPVKTGQILLVYDGSSVADRALEAALGRARATKASITLLAALPPRLWRARVGQFQIPPEKHDEDWARAQLARAQDRVRDAGIHAESLVRVGPPARVIGEEAARGYAALFLSDRPSLTGGPPLARVVTAPDGCEVVAVT
ncbi:MAG: universal stress protein [Actinomycetota bacterium]